MRVQAVFAVRQGPGRVGCARGCRRGWRLGRCGRRRAMVQGFHTRSVAGNEIVRLLGLGLFVRHKQPAQTTGHDESFLSVCESRRDGLGSKRETHLSHLR